MKKVLFNLDNNKIYNTYSRMEYDRYQIDSILFRRGYKRVSDQEWNNVYTLLDIYKLYDMTVHKDSLQNNLYYTKFIN
jgi:hypothetical protein